MPNFLSNYFFLLPRLRNIRYSAIFLLESRMKSGPKKEEKGGGRDVYLRKNKRNAKPESAL